MNIKQLISEQKKILNVVGVDGNITFIISGQRETVRADEFVKFIWQYYDKNNDVCDMVVVDEKTSMVLYKNITTRDINEITEWKRMQPETKSTLIDILECQMRYRLR